MLLIMLLLILTIMAHVVGEGYLTHIKISFVYELFPLFKLFPVGTWYLQYSYKRAVSSHQTWNVQVPSCLVQSF